MMNRVFTRREKCLLLLLTVLLLGLGYVKLFLEPLQRNLAVMEDRQAAAADQLLLEQTKLAQLQTMETGLEEMRNAGAAAAEIPAYDNVENVMVQLHAILAAAQEYSLTFSDVQIGEAGLVSRPIQLTFTAGSYAAARQIIDNLSNSRYRCTVESLSAAAEQDLRRDNPVTVNLTMTFFEKIS